MMDGPYGVDNRATNHMGNMEVDSMPYGSIPYGSIDTGKEETES